MFALAIKDIREYKISQFDSWLISEPRWLEQGSPVRQGDLILGLPQETADLVNYYLLAHLHSDKFEPDIKRTVGMLLGGTHGNSQLFEIDELGEQKFLRELEFELALFAEITGPLSAPGIEVKVQDEILFYDPPAMNDEEE